jgi:hypothetical protein
MKKLILLLAFLLLAPLTCYAADKDAAFHPNPRFTLGDVLFVVPPQNPPGGAMPVNLTWVNAVRHSVTNPVFAQIVTSAGAKVDVFGGGVQFVSGANIGTGTGTIAMGHATTNAPTYTTGKVYPFSLNLNGDLRVVFSNTTIATTQSGIHTFRMQDNSGNGISSTSGAVDVNVKYGITVDVAHGTVDSGNPAKIGFRAALTEIAPVTATQRTDAIGSLVGGLLTHSESLPSDQWENNSNGTAITTTTFVAVVSHIDGYYTDITSFDVGNAHATVGTVVKVVQGTGTLCGTGTIIRYELYAAAGGAGWTKGNGVGVLFSTTLVSQDICIAAVTTGASINWNMKGFFSQLKRVQ